VSWTTGFRKRDRIRLINGDEATVVCVYEDSLRIRWDHPYEGRSVRLVSESEVVTKAPKKKG